jgi:hypothetical protein
MHGYPLPPPAEAHVKGRLISVGAVRALLSGYKKHTIKLLWGLAIAPTFWASWLWPEKTEINLCFLKGHLLRRNINKIISEEYMIFFKILIVKVLFSSLPLKKGMSSVTYHVRERVKKHPTLS